MIKFPDFSQLNITRSPYENQTHHNAPCDACWINKEQQQMIEYLKEENKILQEKLGKKRIGLNNSQRRRLAILAKKLGSKLLSGISSFSPDKLLKWHRQLVAQKIRWK